MMLPSPQPAETLMHTMLNFAALATEASARDPQAGIEAVVMPQTQREAEDAGIQGGVAPLARASQPDLASDVAIEDWDILLGAVKARLKLTVGELLAAVPRPWAPDEAGRVQASVLECVAALDQLHTTLTHELDRRRQLESEVRDAQAGERRARRMALHDSLTLLPNRSFFLQWLAHALAHATPQRRPFAVLYLDLDGFKAINDAHGHGTGDDLLRIVAMRLARAVRAEDVVSRLGGDEFACLLAELPSREQLSHLACKLLDAVSAPVVIGELELSVRPSIGIATWPADGTTSEALLNSADAAMYSAKRQKSGYGFFDERAERRFAPTRA